MEMIPDDMPDRMGSGRRSDTRHNRPADFAGSDIDSKPCWMRQPFVER